MIKYLISLLVVLVLSSCVPINTEDANEAFRYWTQVPLNNSEVKALEGKYWRSAHLTLEYEACLKIMATKAWQEELIKLNKLEVDSSKWTISDKLPKWFTPNSNYERWSSKLSPELKVWQQGDTLFIYDRQL